MTILFNCKTGEAYQVKILAELLTNNLKNGCFDISQSGIFLRMFDQPRKTLVDLELNSENFSTYKFKLEHKFCMGLNLNHFHKMLKSIKKKDSLQLMINAETPTELIIQNIPKENTRITTSGIKIQNIQNIEIDTPNGYNKPIIILSSDFQKMSKELTSIGSNNIKIEAKNCHIDFIADADDILKRRVRLGENDDTDDEHEEQKTYVATFTTDQLSRINKISGLASNIQIFYGTSLPLLFKTYVGNLGKISLYIKSKEMIEKENNFSDSDTDTE